MPERPTPPPVALGLDVDGTLTRITHGPRATFPYAAAVIRAVQENPKIATRIITRRPAVARGKFTRWQLDGIGIDPDVPVIHSVKHKFKRFLYESYLDIPDEERPEWLVTVDNDERSMFHELACLRVEGTPEMQNALDHLAPIVFNPRGNRPARRIDALGITVRYMSEWRQLPNLLELIQNESKTLQSAGV
jgi:hypothetical protein